jgi:hypothetical protein
MMNMWICNNNKKSTFYSFFVAPEISPHPLGFPPRGNVHNVFISLSWFDSLVFVGHIDKIR